MNKFTALGLVTEATKAKQIAVIACHQAAAREAMEHIEAILDDIPASAHVVQRSNGSERISFPNGSLMRFVSQRASLRGISADVVYLDWGVDLSPSLVRDLNAMTAARGGEVVRA